jgi:hypothetical protein
MKVYVLFVHRKSVSKRKVCIIFIKIKNVKNTPKKKKKNLVGFPIPDPGSQIQGSKRHRIPDPDPQHVSIDK